MFRNRATAAGNPFRALCNWSSQSENLKKSHIEVLKKQWKSFEQTMADFKWTEEQSRSPGKESNQEIECLHKNHISGIQALRCSTPSDSSINESLALSSPEKKIFSCNDNKKTGKELSVSQECRLNSKQNTPILCEQNENSVFAGFHPIISNYSNTAMTENASASPDVTPLENASTHIIGRNTEVFNDCAVANKKIAQKQNLVFTKLKHKKSALRRLKNTQDPLSRGNRCRRWTCGIPENGMKNKVAALQELINTEIQTTNQSNIPAVPSKVALPVSKCVEQSPSKIMFEENSVIDEQPKEISQTPENKRLEGIETIMSLKSEAPAAIEDCVSSDIQQQKTESEAPKRALFAEILERWKSVEQEMVEERAIKEGPLRWSRPNLKCDKYFDLQFAKTSNTSTSLKVPDVSLSLVQTYAEKEELRNSVFNNTSLMSNNLSENIKITSSQAKEESEIRDSNVIQSSLQIPAIFQSCEGHYEDTSKASSTHLTGQIFSEGKPLTSDEENIQTHKAGEGNEVLNDNLTINKMLDEEIDNTTPEMTSHLLTTMQQSNISDRDTITTDQTAAQSVSNKNIISMDQYSEDTTIHKDHRKKDEISGKATSFNFTLSPLENVDKFQERDSTREECFTNCPVFNTTSPSKGKYKPSLKVVHAFNRSPNCRLTDISGSRLQKNASFKKRTTIRSSHTWKRILLNKNIDSVPDPQVINEDKSKLIIPCKSSSKGFSEPYCTEAVDVTGTDVNISNSKLDMTSINEVPSIFDESNTIFSLLKSAPVQDTNSKSKEPLLQKYKDSEFSETETSQEYNNIECNNSHVLNNSNNVFLKLDEIKNLASDNVPTPKTINNQSGAEFRKFFSTSLTKLPQCTSDNVLTGVTRSTRIKPEFKKIIPYSSVDAPSTETFKMPVRWLSEVKVAMKEAFKQDCHNDPFQKEVTHKKSMKFKNGIGSRASNQLTSQINLMAFSDSRYNIPVFNSTSILLSNRYGNYRKTLLKDRYKISKYVHLCNFNTQAKAYLIFKQDTSFQKENETMNISSASKNEELRYSQETANSTGINPVFGAKLCGASSQSSEHLQPLKKIKYSSYKDQNLKCLDPSTYNSDISKESNRISNNERDLPKQLKFRQPYLVVKNSEGLDSSKFRTTDRKTECYADDIIYMPSKTGCSKVPLNQEQVTHSKTSSLLSQDCSFTKEPAIVKMPISMNTLQSGFNKFHNQIKDFGISSSSKSETSLASTSPSINNYVYIGSNTSDCQRKKEKMNNPLERLHSKNSTIKANQQKPDNTLPKSSKENYTSGLGDIELKLGFLKKTIKYSLDHVLGKKGEYKGFELVNPPEKYEGVHPESIKKASSPIRPYKPRTVEKQLYIAEIRKGQRRVKSNQNR